MSASENSVHLSVLPKEVIEGLRAAEGGDFIDCTLWKMMATNTKEYCKKGDIVGLAQIIDDNELSILESLAFAVVNFELEIQPHHVFR